MKTINKITIWALSLLSLGVLSSCQPKEVIAPTIAVGVENSTMTFEAVKAEAQVLQVYSNGAWVAECAEEWISIDPMSGSGNVEVTVSVLDNTTVSGGKTVVNLPRQAKIKINGGSSDPKQNGVVTIMQKGDTYYGKPVVSVEEFEELEEGEDCKLAGVVVVALADEYCVVKDETGLVLIKGVNEDTAIGKKVDIRGQKQTINGVCAMVLDITDPVSAEDVSYPEAKDITAGVASYESETVEYVSVAGAVVGFAEDKVLADAVLRVGDSEVALLNQKASKELAAINYHNVVLEGYCVGVNGTSPVLIVVNVKADNGLNESVIPITPEAGDIIFKDDFSWLDPIVEAYRAQAGEDKVGDTVATANKSADAPNIWNIAALNEVFGPAFAAKGYTDLNPEEKLLYLQPGYLKMSKTGGHNTALQLQINSLPSSGVDVDITYEYCMMVQGDGTVDAGPVGVLILGDGQFANGTKLSDGNVSKQAKDTFGWQKTAVMKAKGVTSRTKFVFLMQRIVTDAEGNLKLDEATGEPVFKWDVSGAGRVFIDNITIKASGPDVEPVFADITVDEDVLAFEGEGGEKTIKITASEDFTLEASESWISLDKTEGVKDEETEIVVNVAASDLSQLREGTITIVAADSQKTIRIIQSAAGQDLDPFISINKNYADVDAAEHEITVDVQSTHEYTVASDAAWAQVLDGTKTIVNKESVNIYVEPNTDMVNSREAHVVFAIADKGIETVLTIRQAAKEPDDPTLVFGDKFEWMEDFSVKTGAGDSVGENNPSATAPNIYSVADLESLRTMFADKGYDFINTAKNGSEWVPISTKNEKVVYLQKNYLKFGKTSYNAGIVLPQLKSLTGPTDVKIEFDWCWQVTGSFNADIMTLQVEAAGAGEFVSTSTSVSEEIESAQSTEEGQSKIEWQHATVILRGATAETVLTIRPTNTNPKTSNPDRDQNRWYLDNIEVRKYDIPEPLDVSWSFTADTMNDYKDLFGGTAGVVSSVEGFGELADGSRMRVPSTSGEGGNIYYYQVDKTGTTPTNGNPKRIVGGTGDPYITGGWPGDYWLIEGNNELEYAAGTKVNVNFLTRVSGTGHKYMLAEYWDGEAWQPAFEVKEETETGTNAKYNFVQATSNQEINATWTLAKSTKDLKFRFSIVANWQQNGKGALENPNGGTCRFAERCALKVVTE